MEFFDRGRTESSPSEFSEGIERGGVCVLYPVLSGGHWGCRGFSGEEIEEGRAWFSVGPRCVSKRRTPLSQLASKSSVGVSEFRRIR